MLRHCLATLEGEHEFLVYVATKKAVLSQICVDFWGNCKLQFPYLLNMSMFELSLLIKLKEGVEILLP